MLNEQFYSVNNEKWYPKITIDLTQVQAIGLEQAPTSREHYKFKLYELKLIAYTNGQAILLDSFNFVKEETRAKEEYRKLVNKWKDCLRKE